MKELLVPVLLALVAAGCVDTPASGENQSDAGREAHAADSNYGDANTGDDAACPSQPPTAGESCTSATSYCQTAYPCQFAQCNGQHWCVAWGGTGCDFYPTPAPGDCPSGFPAEGAPCTGPEMSSCIYACAEGTLGGAKAACNGGAFCTVVPAGCTPLPYQGLGSKCDKGATPGTTNLHNPILHATGDSVGHPSSLALDATRLYWADDWGHSIRSMLKSAGPVVVLAQLTFAPHDLAVDANGVYVDSNGSASGGYVAKVALSGGAPTILANGPYLPSGLAADGSFLYWGGWPGLVRLAASGGSIEKLTDWTDSPALAVDGDNLYWAGSTGVYSLAKSGGTPSALATGTLVPGLLAVDSTRVYYVTSGECGTTIRSAPIAGGASVELLYTEASAINAIATDGAYVYYADAHAGLIGRVPCNGGAPDAVAYTTANPVIPFGLAVDGTDVVFASYDASTTTSSVLSVAK